MKSRRLSLFLTFLKIGAFTFGGGYAMIALLEHELIEKKGWIGHDEFLDMAAIAESTPGPVAVNAATYVGYQRKGVWGGCVATLGVVLPSLGIISLLAGILLRIDTLPLVVNAFAGVRVAVAALVVAAIFQLYRQGVRGAGANGLCVGALALSLLGVSPVLVTLGALGLGLLLPRIRRRV